MARLPTSGATVATPAKGETDLRKVLSELCPDRKFSNADSDEICVALGGIIGRWSAEEYRLNIAPLFKAFQAMGRELNKVAKILSGHQTGLHKVRDIEIVSQLGEILALNPKIGSREQADKLITSFRVDAADMAHACLVAACDLKQTVVGKSGAPPQDWYDEFTALLLEVAKTAGIEPRLSKDRISGARGGWLLEAAQALETFLDPKMRSPSAEARFKRLERSKRRLKEMHRQNLPSA